LPRPDNARHEETLDVFWHEDVLLHDTGSGVFEAAASPLLAEQELHPENALRVRNMKAILERGTLRDHVRWRQGRRAEPTELELVHERRYVESIRDFAAAGGGVLTDTTVLRARSWEAALAAAGTALAAAEAVLAGETTLAYALVRPPGHHAQPARADGYCFFNNVALAAELARRHEIERVAVLDWDVHHGNGTQECFYGRADVLTVSLHMRHGSWGPAHPQTGAPDEVGSGEGAGYNVNVELPLGTGDAGYVEAMETVVEPVVDAFAPALLLVAVGQDASQFDPNGRQAVTMAGFRRLGASARALADRHCDGRVVLVQEGGYGRSYSAFCLHATLEGVLGLGATLDDPLAFLPDDERHAGEAIEAVRSSLGQYWPL
jgi:acetoin utilization deacetylase AcuC-like enzyme